MIGFNLYVYNRVVGRMAPATAAAGNFLMSIVTRVKRWSELSRQRAQLAQMSDQMLSDIGLSRADALQEADRYFWDDPTGTHLQQSSVHRSTRYPCAG